MHVVKEYPDSVFSWVDLATTDPDKAKVFYQGLFGWEYEDVPTDMGTVYSMCRINGHNVAGLGPLSPGMEEQGVPPIWSSYINHRDVDAIAARVTEAGGTVTIPPMDVMDTGRMFVANDPTGAPFGVWQPKSHIGAQYVNYPNTLVWNELQTRDVEAAKKFYGAVFDWTYKEDENGYVMCVAGDRIQAGIIEIDENWGADMPPHWAVYFLVEGADACAEKVTALGGNVLAPPAKAGEMGKFAVVQDPQGGTFTVMEFNGPADPPPGADAA